MESQRERELGQLTEEEQKSLDRLIGIAQSEIIKSAENLTFHQLEGLRAGAEAYLGNPTPDEKTLKLAKSIVEYFEENENKEAA